jgi:hypothetical protein
MNETIDRLRDDCCVKQKKGLHFIVASVFIWSAVLLIHSSSLPIESKNLFTFCCSAPLMPLAYMISKIIKVDFQNKSNPLTSLGIIFSVGQMPYLLIAAAILIIAITGRILYVRSRKNKKMRSKAQRYRKIERKRREKERNPFNH